MAAMLRTLLAAALLGASGTCWAASPGSSRDAAEPPPGPPDMAPYAGCYLSVHPFSDGNPRMGAYPLAGKDNDIIILPGNLGERRGVFAYTEGAAFFHEPAREPRRKSFSKKRPSGFPDIYELIVRLPEHREVLLVYKERFKKPYPKRKPASRPASLALYPVSYLDPGKTETAGLDALEEAKDRSDAFSLLRIKLAERIDSMEGHYKRSRKRYKKDIVGIPGPSEYYRSLKGACESTSDHAISNAVSRAKRYFLKRR